MKKLKTLILTLCVVFTVNMTAAQAVFAAESDTGVNMYQQSEIRVPSSVKAVSSGANSIKLSWKKVSGADKYQIYSCDTKSNTWKRVRTTAKTETTFTGLSKNTTYQYKVRVVDAGKTSEFSSEVSSKTGVVTKISLNRSSKCIYGSETFTLKATVTAKAPSKTVRWTSADESIAEVSTSGKVTAKGKGTVKITAEAHNGAVASCMVTVGTEFDKAFQQEMLRLVNELRKQKGLPSIKYAYEIQAATDTRAYEAWAYKKLGHMRYNKYGKEVPFNSVYEDLGLKISYSGTGENLAWRSNSFADPVAAARAYFEQWKNSPSHRENILRKGIKSMAVSYIYRHGPEYAGASAQLFLM